MKQGLQLVVDPVRDLARAKSLYRAGLGVEPSADMPYYVGFGSPTRRSASIRTATPRA